MPDAHNFTEPSLVIDSIDDAIWAKNDLTNIVVPVLRNTATKFWKFLESICLGNQLVSKRHRAIRIIACNEDDYIVKVSRAAGDQISL